MKTCLVVDDSALVRKLAFSMLGEMGFSCTGAADGAVALDACKADMPDLVLLDWTMPGMDGIAFLKALRETAPEHMPKIVFCTAHNRIEDLRAALVAGADEYIMKPFDNEILRSKLEIVGLLPPS